MHLPLDWDMFQSPVSLRRERLLHRLQSLTAWHREHCVAYRAIVDAWPATESTAAVQDVVPPSLENLPWLPTRLFKRLELRSVAADAVARVLTSSGTSGAAVSRVLLDATTAAMQSRILVRTLEAVLGKRRLPVVLAEPAQNLSGGALSARGAGTLGVSLFGRSLQHLVDADGTWNITVLRDAARASRQGPVVVFGFTFMIWQLLEFLLASGERMDFGAQAVLLHTGGWKKLQALAVDGADFRHRVADVLGIRQVHDFYGMAEQTGSVFLACSEGHLHCSAYNHVVIRDPQTWATLPTGRLGIVQVLSALPQSYPGHSLLTEDLGRLLGDDGCPCGWSGPYFEVTGRVPGVQMRGCSNV